MTSSGKKILAFLGLLLLASSPAVPQTEEGQKILDQSGTGVLALIFYGEDKAEIGKGSGLALTEDVVATAYHVVSKAFDIQGLSSKGKKIKVEGIIGVDKARDIALLKIKGKLQPLSAGDPAGLAEGARLFALGSDESGQIAVSEGTFRRLAAIRPQERILELSLTIPESFRGGPIVDIGGQLVAMTLVLERGIKVGLPLAGVLSIPRSVKPESLKSQSKEEYFETFEGASFAGLIAATLQEDLAARLYLEKATSLNPSFIEGLSLLGDVYGKQRDYSSAVAAYRKVTELDGSRADIFYKLGRVLMRMTNHREAVEAMEKAISLNIDSKEIHFELGTACEALEDWERAAAAYEKFLSLKPDVAWNGYLRLGFSLTKLGRYDQAIAAYLEARKAEPKDLKVNFSLAEAYEKAGRLEEAEGVYDELAALNPVEAKSYYAQAIRMYDTAGKFDKAIGPAKKIIDLEPNSEMNLYNLGLMYFKMQKYDEAVEAFQRCLAVNPDYAYAWFQIGSSQIQKKAYKEAAEAYKKFVALSPDEPSGWLSLGICYMQLKNFEAALEPMRKAVELKPDSAVGVYNLAIVYLNLKDNYSAKDLYNKLVNLDPELAQKLKKHIR